VDVANVRAKPDAQAALVGRLRIGTVVDVLPAEAEWSSIVLRNSLGTLKGFVLAASLEAHCPVLATLVEAARAAQTSGDAAQALQWAERAWALDQYDAGVQALMTSLYTGTAQESKLAEVGAVARGVDDPVVAVCAQWSRLRGRAARGPNAIVIGVMKGNGTLERMVEEFNEVGPTKYARIPGQQQTAEALRVAPWYSMSPTGEVARLEGTPFALAFVTDDGCDCPSPKVVLLGRCDVAGTIYATRPLTPVTRKPARSLTRAQAAKLFPPGKEDDVEDCDEAIFNRGRKNAVWSLEDGTPVEETRLPCTKADLYRRAAVRWQCCSQSPGFVETAVWARWATGNPDRFAVWTSPRLGGAMPGSFVGITVVDRDGKSRALESEIVCNSD